MTKRPLETRIRLTTFEKVGKTTDTTITDIREFPVEWYKAEQRWLATHLARFLLDDIEKAARERLKISWSLEVIP